MQDLGIPQFQTADVARAANVSFATLNSWLTRGLVDLSHAPSQPPGTGRPRLFSRRRARHIALTAELTRLGLTIKRASRAALHFSDLGDTHPSWRDPGGLFKTGTTMLFVYTDEGDVDVPTAAVRQIEAPQILLPTLFHCETRPALQATVVIVDVNRLCDRVDRALDGQIAGVA